MRRNYVTSEWLKISIICISFLIFMILAYLFALNGRFIRYGDTGIYDKWKNEAYSIGSEEIPYMYNGVDVYNNDDASR